MVICVRTCPYQSWTNVAERVMSTLNLALMNVSLCRSALPSEYETLMKSKKTLTEVRELIMRKPEIKPLLLDTMQGVVCTMTNRFSHMEIKDEAFRIAIPASDDEISEHFEHVRFIEPDLRLDKPNQESLAKSTNLQKFIEKHCFCSKYLFQVKKCLDPSCFYCTPVLLQTLLGH